MGINAISAVLLNILGSDYLQKNPYAEIFPCQIFMDVMMEVYSSLCKLLKQYFHIHAIGFCCILCMRKIVRVDILIFGNIVCKYKILCFWSNRQTMCPQNSHLIKGIHVSAGVHNLLLFIACICDDPCQN